MAQRPKTVTLAVVGVTAPIPTNRYSQNPNIGVGCVVTGTVNYTVQHTFDDVQAAGYVAASGNWFDHATIVAQTISKDGNYFAPVRAIRLKYNSGTGSVSMTLVHGGGGAK